MKLLVRHQTVYDYEAGSSRVAMLLKLWPRDHEGQRVLEWRLSVNGEPVTDFVTNGYGDREALWIRHDPTSSAVILAEGLVETEDKAGVVRGLDERFDPRIYLRETPLTAVTPAIRELGGSIADTDALARLHSLCALVRARVDYRAGVTTPDTTAGEALTLGAGVCQDHAQLFIAAARAMGVPARYVTGYLLAQGEDALHETHGWAEAWVPGVGWVGFDASNQLCPTEYYLRVASGLDAHDAAPVRGSVTAAGTIRIDADVRIAQASDDAQEQQLQKQQQQQRQLPCAPDQP